MVAPPWEPPPPGGVVDEVSAVLLPRLLKALSLPQAQQPGHVFTAPIPPPATLSGTAMSGTDTDAAIAPVALLQVAVSGDPFLSLGLGYGTNLPDGKAGNFDDFQQGAEYDYMVTAPYARGVDPGGEPVELASLALRPLRPFPPPIPANMGSKLRAHLAPVVPDADWRASTITRWDRPLDAALVRVASHAVTRHRPGDTAAEALLEKRASRGHHPITPAVDVEDDESNFVHYADRQFAIPANPGHVAVRYSVANQNIFGMWSNWMNSQVDVAQPQLLPPRVLAADLEVGVPATGTACPAALTVDVTWDWTDRRPAELRIVGRLFPAADRSATVANVPPAGLDRQLGVAGTAIVLTFSGDSATMSGAPAGSELLYLDPQGSEEVLPGAPQGDGARRYRVRIVGMMCDFASTDHIGAALWTSGSERIAPGRTAATVNAFYAYASDPIAPAVPAELVPLSSLPDSGGQSHAKISWPAVPGAAAYVVYGSDEITMRANYGMGEPNLNDTLSDRLTELLDAWVADPDRRTFTRLTSKPVTGTSVDLALPRGTTGISTFVVLSMSAGEVEGNWPVLGATGLRDAVIVRATPRIAAPSTPEIEARVDGSTVHLIMRTRPGHRVGEVQVYRVRVDEAARELDTMGPPVATVAEGAPGWTVETDADGTPLVFTGTDTPGTSWRRVWYRAVAWADPEYPVAGEPFPYKIAERGLLSGRSEPSNSVSVTVPPPNPPNLSPIAITWPGGNVADVQLDWTTTAPFTAPLGVHRTEVDIRVSGTTTSLVTYAGPLGDVADAAPSAGDGLWRDDGSAPAAFHAVIRRPDEQTELDAVVRVIDPLGRATQHTIHVGAGSVIPPPDLSNLDVFRITGRGTILTFDSTSPVELVGGQPYVLRVEATTAGPGRPPFPPFPITPVLPRPIPPIRPGGLTRIRPGAGRPGDAFDVGPDDVGFVRPQPGRPLPSDLVFPTRPVVLTVNLSDIPLDTNQPPSGDPLEIRRMRGAGSTHSYAVRAGGAVTGFKLSLRSPDGRTATAAIGVPRS